MADSPKNRVGRLQYPIDKENQYNTKIKFQAVRVIPPSVNSLGVKNAVTSIGGPPGSGARNNNNGGNVANDLQFYNIDGEVADLFVPLGGYQVNDGFDYSSASLGLLGAGISATLNKGGTIGQAVMQGVSEAGQSILDAFNVIKGDKSIGRTAALRAAQLIPNEAARSAVGITGRFTMNPNIRTQFNGVSVREFTFQFKFVPTSREESLAVKSIIQFFRFHAYPEELTSAGSFSVGFDYPNMFKIKLLSNSGDSVFKNIGTPIKLCYLKSISTTYNSTSPVLHSDGSPTEIDMNLTFVEYKSQTRKDIEDEDNDSFYQFENGRDVTATQGQ